MQQLEKTSQLSQEQDYRALYEAQKNIRHLFERKAQLAQNKLKRLLKYKQKNISQQYDGYQKSKDYILHELKNFDTTIPINKQKVSQFQSQHGCDEYSLFSYFAVYGIPDETIKDFGENKNQLYNGQILFSSEIPPEILMHSSKLVFPSGVQLQKYYGTSAKEKGLEIMSCNYNNIKSFLLSFESPQGQCPFFKSVKTVAFENTFLSFVNPQKRIFAICFKIPEYTIIPMERQYSTSMELIKSNQQLLDKQYPVSFTNLQNSSSSLDLDICLAVSQRVYCIFTHYPFFTFFENVLKSMLVTIKMQRLVFYREDEEFQNTDSKYQLKRMKQLCYQSITKLKMKRNVNFDQQISVCFPNGKKVSLLTEYTLSQNYFIQEWIYPVIRLFTCETFINVFTLAMLQQKIVFVSTNQHILSYMVYLFTNIVQKPFRYPYPVVPIIPDEQDYLNAPFPVVYGYLKDRKTILDNQLHKLYKNIYIIVEKQGIQIISQQCKASIIQSKPKKLKQKLSPLFQQLHQHSKAPKKSKLVFEDNTFDLYSTKKNIQISIKILKQVWKYMHDDIYALLPKRQEVKKLKVQYSKFVDDSQDLTHQVYKHILSNYQNKSQDMFFLSFLRTQLFNVHIFG